MSNDNKNKIYTAEEIEQYFRGKLNAQQMYEMEKAALDDPFLAEAMEGYEGMKDKEWKKQLVAVRKQVAEVESEAKVIPMHRSTGRWWKAAAAVLILGCGGLLTYVLTKNNDSEKTVPQVAQTIQAAPEPVIATDSIPIPQQIKTIPPVATVAPRKDTITTSYQFAAIVPDEKKDEAFVYKADKSPATASANANGLSINDRNKSNDLANKINSNASLENVAGKTNNAGVVSSEGIANNYVTEKAKKNAESLEYFRSKSAKTVTKKAEEPNNYFNAQVVGDDNSPLPFTNISIKSENFGTYADVKGNFRLISPDTVLTVEVRSVGYEPVVYSLRSNRPLNKIVLREDETAMKSRKTADDKDIATTQRLRVARVVSDTLINVEPADGWDNYNTYVANNLDIPEELLKNEFHGEVELSFDVRPDGAISNIRINKSMGEAYDEAAKKLIRQGPQWKVKKGKKTTASVKVQF